MGSGIQDRAGIDEGEMIGTYDVVMGLLLVWRLACPLALIGAALHNQRVRRR